MVKKSSNSTLSILMNGINVGELEKKKSREIAFTYCQSWLDLPGSRPISLSLPLTSQTYTGETIYNFLDNLLPDSQQVRDQIRAQHNIPTTHPFDILASIGKDCVGAIQFAKDSTPTFKKEIKYRLLTDQEIAHKLRNYKINPLGMSHEDQDFRISIAGAQEKTAFLYHQKRWCEPIAETPTTHLFKLPIGFLPQQGIDLSDSCENEWLCSQLAQAYGLPTANCEILHFEDMKVLSVTRFDRRLSQDRKWILRLPQEDMCQALGVSPENKYEAENGPGIKDIMEVLLGSATPTNDRDKFYQTQILFWLIAGIDGHAKNFSLFIEPEGRYRSTPLYDIISAYPIIKEEKLHAKKIKMAMSLQGKNKHYHWYNIQRRHFMSAAKNAEFSEIRAENILNAMLTKTDSVIEKVSKSLPKNFPNKIAEPIFAGILETKKKLS